MQTFKKLKHAFQVAPDSHVRLSDFDPGWAGNGMFKELTRAELKARARALLERNVAELAEAQETLYAADRHSVLIVLQALDAAGKDGTIKHVMSGVNPQGCQVFAFKQPSREELDHNFLWRYMKALPERGRIGIFNRSYYEDVLVVRVHPELVAAQRLPGSRDHDAFWRERYDDINRFERHLVRNGTVILKFFLHVSKKEQRTRIIDRLQKPDEHWKFSAGDLEERRYWDKYRQAYEQVFRHTSTRWAPWWVIPADHKWVTRALVAAVVTRTIKRLGERPELSAEQRRSIRAARRGFGLGSRQTRH